MVAGVVLVTGSSTGIGRTLVEGLKRRGATPVATMRDIPGRNAAHAEALRAGGIDVVELDVTSDASVSGAVDQVLNDHGRIDVVVNNAGVGLQGPLEAATPEDLHRHLDVNVVGAHRVTRAVLPGMRERGEGLLVFVSSGAGRVSFPGFGAYCAAKWRLEAMAETLRYEVSPFGVDAIIVEPGAYDTDFHGRSMQ